MRQKIDCNTKIAMIENQELITKKQIEFLYGLTSEEVDDAVRQNDLDKPIPYVGQVYYFNYQIEALANAMIKNGIGDHLTIF